MDKKLREAGDKMARFIMNWRDCLEGVQMSREDFLEGFGVNDWQRALRPTGQVDFEKAMWDAMYDDKNWPNGNEPRFTIHLERTITDLLTRLKTAETKPPKGCAQPFGEPEFYNQGVEWRPICGVNGKLCPKCENKSAVPAESVNGELAEEDPRLPSQTVWVWDGQVYDCDPEPGIGFSPATKYIRADLAKTVAPTVNREVVEAEFVRKLYEVRNEPDKLNAIVVREYNALKEANHG